MEATPQELLVASLHTLQERQEKMAVTVQALESGQHFEEFANYQIKLNELVKSTTSLYRQLNKALAGDERFSRALDDFTGETGSRTRALTKLMDAITLDQASVDRLLARLEESLLKLDGETLNYLDGRNRELSRVFDTSIGQIERFVEVEQELFDKVAKNLEAKGFGSSIDQLNRLERIELLAETATNHLLDTNTLERQRALHTTAQPVLNLAAKLAKNPLAKGIAWVPWIALAFLFFNSLLLFAMIGLLTKPG